MSQQCQVYDDPIKILQDSFDLLANEVQSLSDRRTILEHKLRFAHEQYQQLADKYAPASPDILNIVSKLQLPPDTCLGASDRATKVPLPHRSPGISKQQTAEAIRDGRRASQQIKSLKAEKSPSTTERRPALSSTICEESRSRASSSTVLEQDFTKPGRKGSLLCPFARTTSPGHLNDTSTSAMSTCPKSRASHALDDPICVALYRDDAKSTTASVSASAPRCPIRFLDHHTPEEVAQYFEIHKHEIPRSHEVCVKRYQKNETDLRKLDAKYGNLVSMIQGLGEKHQPLLGHAEHADADLDRDSNKRIETWATSMTTDEVLNNPDEAPEGEPRAGRFDRQLREIRVGESPTRPWGISVPVTALQPTQDMSMAPVDVPVDDLAHRRTSIDHANEALRKDTTCGQTPHTKQVDSKAHTGAKLDGPTGNRQDRLHPVSAAVDGRPRAGGCPFSSMSSPRQTTEPSAQQGPARARPILISPESDLQQRKHQVPMVFNGPVFIGYPIEQAMSWLRESGHGT